MKATPQICSSRTNLAFGFQFSCAQHCFFLSHFYRVTFLFPSVAHAFASGLSFSWRAVHPCSGRRNEEVPLSSLFAVPTLIPTYLPAYLPPSLRPCIYQRPFFSRTACPSLLPQRLFSFDSSLFNRLLSLIGIPFALSILSFFLLATVPNASLIFSHSLAQPLVSPAASFSLGIQLPPAFAPANADLFPIYLWLPTVAASLACSNSSTAA